MTWSASPQTAPMDLRIGQRFVKPGSDTALLALKQTQQLQHQFFLASLHQQQVEQLTHQQMRVRSPCRGSGHTKGASCQQPGVGVGGVLQRCCPGDEA